MSQMNLLKVRRFAPLFWTQFLGAFNDNFLKNALVILITFKATAVLGIPSAQMVAVAGGIFVLPYFLFSATAGQLADKLEKSRIIRWIKLIEIAIMVLAAVGFLTNHFEFLLIVLFLMGTHSAFFGPLKYSILPQHLSEEELVGGNALVEAGTFLAILIGTIMGGVLVLWNGGLWIVSAGLMAVAIAGYLASRRIPEAKAVDPNLKVQWNIVTPTIEILRFTKKTRSVFLSVLGISWFWFYGAAMLSLFPSYGKEVLHADQGVVTLFLSIFSIGIGLGSLLCEKLSRKHLELGLVPLGSIGISLFTADLYWASVPLASIAAKISIVENLPPLTVTAFLELPGVARLLFDLLMLSIFSGFYTVPLYTMMQERSEKSHRSRVIAGNNILNAIFMVVASGMLMGLMIAKFTIPEIFLVLAVLNALVAIYIYTVLPEFLLRFGVWMIANLLYRLKITGDHVIPRTGAAVLVCNHVSFVDWMIIAAGVKRPVRFIMDHNYAKGLLGRMLLKQGKVILIAPEHESPEVLKKAFDRIAFELRDGEMVCIFPEGKITKDGKLNPFRTGVERILAETPVPVIPMALRGLWGSFFSREGGAAIKKWPKRFWSRVELVMGEPVLAADATAARLQQKVAELRGTDL